MSALNTGFKATLKDPTASIGPVKAAEPLSNEGTELKRLQLAISANMVNDEVRRNGLLAIDPARMQRAIEQVVAAFELETKPTVAQVFTGAYLPPATEPGSTDRSQYFIRCGSAAYSRASRRASAARSCTAGMVRPPAGLASSR